MGFIFIIDAGTYKNDIMVSVGCDPDEVIKEFEEKSGSQLNEQERDSFRYEQKTNARTIWMKRFRIAVMQFRKISLDSESIAVVSHEVFHTVAFLFNSIGIHLTDASDEAYAYQIEYITERIFREITKRNRRTDDAKTGWKKKKSISRRE